MCQRKEKLLRNFHVPKKGKTTDKMSWVKKSENKKRNTTDKMSCIRNVYTER